MWNSSTEAFLGWALIILCLFGWFNLFLRLFDFVKVYWYVIRDYEYEPTEMAAKANALRWHLIAWVISVFFMTWVIRNFL